MVHQNSFTLKEGTKAVAAEQLEEVPIFLATLSSVISQLKNRLQQQYERAYPGLGDIIRYVIDEEESAARDLCFPFPHLVLPDMVEAHFAQLGLALANHPDKLAASPIFPETQEHAAQAVGQVYQSLIS
jgi:hypothetical protein